MVKVIGVGDNVVDHYLHTNTMYPGGNALNFAVYAHMQGYPAAYLGVFGDNCASEHVYRVLHQLGIPTEHSRFFCGEGGRARVTLDQGDRVFHGSNKGGISKEHPFCFSRLDLEYLKQFDLIHTSIFSYIDAELPKLSAAGIRISYDFSNYFDQEKLKEVCPYLWCACLSSSERSDEENVALAKETLSYGCHMVLITCGERGAMLAVGDHVFRQSPCLVQATDTMGAGDSFISAFLVSYLDAVAAGRDFPPAAAAHGIVTWDEFHDTLIRLCLHRAAVFSANTCLQTGSFGYGAQWTE